ncbi:hypothetical protein [Roseovarius sp. EL26]|uniref:hypothetical protein n=1 Tax=Roseovarius sp. EL26 TaxID=2126672 RepID=UPI000EA0AC0E|nr:hypothetical protein [Roseovarius sp. EL26]
MNEEQKQAFQDRVARLSDKGKAQVEARSKTRKKGVLLERLAFPISIIGSLALGYSTAFVSRYVMYHMVGVPKPGSVDIASLIFAAAIVLTMSAILKSKQKECATASTIGLLLAVFTLHNFVWEYPDLFAQVYGPDWVKAVQQQTEPYSLFVFGRVIELG